MSPKTAFVVRATGSQGAAVTKHLLTAKWTVRALVTDASNPRATALQDLGAILVQGSLGNSEALKPHFQGIDSLFLNQMPSFTDDTETREAKAILDLAREAGVKHVVHATTLALCDPNIKSKLAEHPIRAAIFGKGDVQDLVRRSGMDWTILRPGYFMTNFVMPLSAYMWPDLVSSSTLLNSFSADTVLPLIDPHDIGAFAAAAFQEPEKYRRQIIALAGEKLNIEQIVAALSNASGREIKAVYRTAEETEKAAAENLLIAGQLISSDLDVLVNVKEVESWGVPLTSFDEFLAKHKDGLKVQS